MPRKKTTDENAENRRIAAMVRKSARLEQQIAKYDRALGERLADLKERDARTAELEGMVASASEALSDATETGTRLQRQLEHMRATYDALAQRYVGVKLDTQQFTIDQARQWLSNEASAVFTALTLIQREVSETWAKSRETVRFRRPPGFSTAMQIQASEAE